MRKARAKRAALASAALAVTGMIAFPASAAAGPGCEHFLGPETCYETQAKVSAIVDPLYMEVYETEDEAWEHVFWAVDTYNGIYYCTVPWGYCPD